jgi:hypothetical protein
MKTINDITGQRLTEYQKNANKKAWYKTNADRISHKHNDTIYLQGDVSESRRMKVNYDLFNNILNLEEFNYVCKPYGGDVGELPAKMTNKDIVSGKIKAILGMEMKRPFAYNAIAVNPEATTRKEQEELRLLKDSIYSSIMLPIKAQIEEKKLAEMQGQELTPDQQREIQAQVEQELQTKTPEEIKKYMAREHKDPVEIMSQQLLEYLIQKCDLKRKFNLTLKHGLLSAKGIMYVGILNGEPEVWNVNSMRFNGDTSPDIQFIEEGEYASCEYPMQPSEIVKYFGDELTEEEMDKIYKGWIGERANLSEEDLFHKIENQAREHINDNETLTVIHTVWKALRKIGFLTYIKEDSQEPLKMLVSENYELNPDAGDISLEWEWIPEVYETWTIKTIEPIYLKMQPIPGQNKDIDNLYHCPLPYYGVIYDNMNSTPTSLMDRVKMFQYVYNIIHYRIEILVASDRGKKVLMNINAIPASAGIDIKKWQYFMDSTPTMWYDPNEEGVNYGDATNIAKVIDLSMASVIDQYMNLAEAIRQQCGRSVGITDHVEGQISPNDSVGGTRTALIQSSHILEPYFELHNYVKRNVLQALLETAKVAYAGSSKKKLTYILDDMSQRILELDTELLDNSTVGVFVSNSAKAEEAKETIRQLAHAALQSQKIEMSDVISIIRQESVSEAEELLRMAEMERIEREQQQQQSQQQAQEEMAQKEREFIREQHEMEKEIVILKEEEKRKTVVVQNAIMAASFNPDEDKDNDGLNDFMEVAKYGLDADVKRRNVRLQENKFEHQKKIDEKKLEQNDEKLKIDKRKLYQKAASK